MVVGYMKDCEKYYSLHKDFKKAFEWLKSLDENSEKKRCEIDGDNVWGNIFVDVNRDGEKLYEAHGKYIDIHFILKGDEEFGYADTSTLCVNTEYSEENDCAMFSGPIEKITLKEGMFCIVYPEDAHIPSLKVDGSAFRAMTKVLL